MKTPLPPDPADHRGLRADLADARALSGLDGPGTEAPAAAYRLAVALGRCRLAGVAVDDLCGPLPAAVAAAAADELCVRLAGWTDDARRLSERWDQAADLPAAEALSLSLLAARLEAWAAWVAIDESCQAAVERGEANLDSTAAVLDRVLDALDAFDRELQAQRNLLAVAAETGLLAGWRAALAQPYRAVLPWWLDGTLEAAAEASRRAVCAELPGPSAWARLRAAPGRIVQAFPKELLGAPLAAAVLSAPRLLQWRSPDGRFVAVLALTGRETLSLRIYTAAGEYATALAGQPVVLAGVRAVVDAEGRATFALPTLRAAGADLRLEVGSDAVVWQPQPPWDETRPEDRPRDPATP